MYYIRKVPRGCLTVSDNTLFLSVGMEVQILKRFRENDDPTLGLVDGKQLETLSKEELISAGKKRVWRTQNKNWKL